MEKEEGFLDLGICARQGYCESTSVTESPPGCDSEQTDYSFISYTYVPLFEFRRKRSHVVTKRTKHPDSPIFARTTPNNATQRLITSRTVSSIPYVPKMHSPSPPSPSPPSLPPNSPKYRTQILRQNWGPITHTPGQEDFKDHGKKENKKIKKYTR